MFQSFNNFVIIDDDSCHNIVCALSLKKVFKHLNINIVGFTDVSEGVAHLEKTVSGSASKTILLLDINMPGISGWDVLAKIETMPETVRKNIIVYMLSASVSMVDRAKAFAHTFVKDCLEKPLSDHLLYISEELNEMALLKKMYA